MYPDILMHDDLVKEAITLCVGLRESSACEWRRSVTVCSPWWRGWTKWLWKASGG